MGNYDFYENIWMESKADYKFDKKQCRFSLYYKSQLFITLLWANPV